MACCINTQQEDVQSSLTCITHANKGSAWDFCSFHWLREQQKHMGAGTAMRKMNDMKTNKPVWLPRNVISLLNLGLFQMLWSKQFFFVFTCSFFFNLYTTHGQFAEPACAPRKLRDWAVPYIHQLKHTVTSLKSRCPGRQGNQSPRTDTGVSGRRNAALCCFTSGLPQSAALSLCMPAKHFGHCGQYANSKHPNICSLAFPACLCAFYPGKPFLRFPLPDSPELWSGTGTKAAMLLVSPPWAQGMECKVETASLLLSRETTAVAVPVLSSVSVLLLLK